MPTLRRATIADAALITEQRHLMFANNDFTTEERLREMDAAFEPWGCTHPADDTYVGLFLDEAGKVPPRPASTSWSSHRTGWTQSRCAPIC